MSQEIRDLEAGAALKNARQQANRSQEDICFDLGFDQSSFSKMERLGPRVTTWTRFCSMANLLGYELEVVFHPIGKGGDDNAAGRRRPEGKKHPK